MSVTRDRVKSGLKAAETNRKKHGDDFYQRINKMSHNKGHKGGFASSNKGSDGLTGKERAKKFGSVGGKKSKRGQKLHSEKVTGMGFEEIPHPDITDAIINASEIERAKRRERYEQTGQ